MKFTDKFIPPLPEGINKKFLISTYIQKRQLPNLEMSLKNDTDGAEVIATVKFNFILIKKTKDLKVVHTPHTRIISGTSEEVYHRSTKQSSRIGLNLERQFNSLWNRTLMQLLN